jgi:hypothetical protein
LANPLAFERPLAVPGFVLGPSYVSKPIDTREFAALVSSMLPSSRHNAGAGIGGGGVGGSLGGGGLGGGGSYYS